MFLAEWEESRPENHGERIVREQDSMSQSNASASAVLNRGQLVKTSVRLACTAMNNEPLDTTGFKYCRQCRKTVPAIEFINRDNTGYCIVCKTCRDRQLRRYYGGPLLLPE